MSNSVSNSDNLDSNAKNTKEKIVEVASRLFAKFGYENASVRDISNEAGVNVASINYHFKNKQNLYKEVMNFNIIKADSEIGCIAQNSKNMEELAQLLFDFFTNNASTFLNAFKLFTNTTLPEDEEIIPEACQCNGLNPPGYRHILAVLNNEIPADTSESDKQWAVHTLFTYITHTSLIMCSTYGKMMANKAEFKSPEKRTEHLIMTVRAIVKYLNK